MMRIMQPANRGLACRIPCCRSQSGLFSASAVNVREREAHEYMHPIQPCNTHLYCIVVTSWHCVLHHKLAINKLTTLDDCVFISRSTNVRHNEHTRCSVVYERCRSVICSKLIHIVLHISIL